MSLILDSTSSRLFQATRDGFQSRCQQLIDDILYSGLSLEDELAGRLKRAGQMMAIDCPTNELVHVAPTGFFTVLIDHPEHTPMSEFDWACLYTADTLNMLTGDLLRHRPPAEVVRDIETQSFLWDLAVPFPATISQAEDTAPAQYVNALRIPRADRFSLINSRIPVRPGSPPPVDTYVAYNRPVPGPYTPALPLRPVPEFEFESEPESPAAVGTGGLYMRPNIQPR
ncbi:hypothetical protein N7463_002055 [Penicillium fimorum]|uniref:Uncharacterized protein n=1 Tax=Penicillium fimorum TaxID=1882269 RepID=A0A9W9XYM5_9EURO|nr:hypothetical protein N7463_002055 [Penicillium fimorum]